MAGIGRAKGGTASERPGSDRSIIGTVSVMVGSAGMDGTGIVSGGTANPGIGGSDASGSATLRPIAGIGGIAGIGSEIGGSEKSENEHAVTSSSRWER